MKSERNWGRLGMKSNWMTTTINDVCSLVTDGAHNSPKSVEKGRYMASVKDFTEFADGLVKKIMKDFVNRDVFQRKMISWLEKMGQGILRI